MPVGREAADIDVCEIDSVTEQAESILSRTVLECQADGVIAVKFDGTIMLVNAAAADILELDREEVLGRNFAQAFFASERLDEFNQAILDAVAERAVGSRRIATVQCGEQTKILSVTSSYLKRGGDSQKKALGVVAVFSDTTEIEELRRAEARMAELLKSQNGELQQAYREIEESNSELESTAKKMQVARIAATGLVIALFVAAGAFGWVFRPADEFLVSGVGDANASLSAATQDAETLATFTVRPKPVTSSISLAGRLAPWRKVNVTSRVSGKIASVFFQYGQAVQQGQRLVELETSDIVRKHRELRRDYIKALKEFREVRDWESGPEVSQARRAFTKAEVALRSQKTQLDIAAALLEEGVIPANQHRAAQRQHFNLQLDFAASRQNLETVLAKNNEESLQMAELALDNARERMHAQERRLKDVEVRAPIAGIVLDIRKGAGAGAEGGDGKLAKGQSVQEGQLLLTIGDLQRMSVVTAVDEAFIPQVRAGQRVRATGDGFPGLVIEGELSRVSSEARTSERSVLPTFEVVGLLQALDPAQRDRLRLGMSVDLEVVTYHNPAALMVPLTAIVMRENRPWLRVKEKELSRIREVQVKTGVTTIDSVEVLQGIEADDEIVVAGN